MLQIGIAPVDEFLRQGMGGEENTGLIAHQLMELFQALTDASGQGVEVRRASRTTAR